MLASVIDHRPQALRAPHGANWIEIDWPDAKARRIPTVILRGYCPCAHCQGHGGPIEFQPGRDSDLIDLGEVGNYALRFGWGDGHDSGLYSFSYLRALSDLYQEHGDKLPEAIPQLHRG